jgi:hypothetical protein
MYSTHFDIHAMACKLEICVSVMKGKQKMMSIRRDICKEVPRPMTALSRLRQCVRGASARSHVVSDIVSMPWPRL